jgi:TfoX/Sxy family transcriptional regulator of competence genes
MADHKKALIDRYCYALQDALLEFSPQSNLVMRRMFGGAGFYVDGYFMAAWFGEGGLALKLCEADRLALLAVEGTSPTMSQHYIGVPDSWLEDSARLAVWVEKSLQYVRSLTQQRRR